MDSRTWRDTAHRVAKGLTQLKPLSAHTLSKCVREEAGGTQWLSLSPNLRGAVLGKDSPDGQKVWPEDWAGSALQTGEDSLRHPHS